MTERNTTRARAAIVALGIAVAALGATAGAAQGVFELRPATPVAAVPPIPPGLFGVELVVDDNEQDGAFGVAGAGGARQFLWFNAFERPAGVGRFDLEEIWVLFPSSAGAVPGDPVELAVWVDADGDPANGATLLATFDVSVQAADDATFSIYPVSVSVEPPGEVLIGVINRYVASGADPVELPASLDTTASAGRSWFAVWSGDPPDPPALPPDDLIARIDDFNPEAAGNWMIRGFGNQDVLEVPTLGGAALAALALLVALAALVVIRRTRRAGALLALVLAALAAAATPAAAQVTVDDFATAQGPDEDPGTSSSTVSGAVILGGERDQAVTRTGGSGTVSAEVTGGALVFSAPSVPDATAGSVVVSWDGADGDPESLDPTGLGGVDLTDGGTQGALRISVDAATAGAQLVVEVYTDAANSSRAARVLPAIAAPTDVLIDFGELAVAEGTGADLADVGAVVLRVLGEEVAVTLGEIVTVPPLLTATKTDALVSDLDMDSTADPGDTVRYTVTITNTGGEAATVDLSDMVDANTTLVGASVSSTPIAKNDHFRGFGNVTLTVDGVTIPDLLANDTDPDGDTLTISAFDGTTVKGGTVSMLDTGEGTFDYLPPAGFRGADSFTYTVIDDDGNTATATATVTLAGIVWFVDNTAGCSPTPCGSGTQGDPFDTLQQAETASAAGDVIRLREGDGTSTGYDLGLAMKTDQRLIGGGVALVLDGQTLEPADPGRPQLTHGSGSDGIVLAAGNTIHGVDVVATDARGLSGSSVGHLEIREASITDAGAEAIAIDGGELDVELDDVSSDGSAGDGLRLSNVTGTLTVSGGTTVVSYGGDGIAVSGSPGASVDFGTTSVDSMTPMLTAPVVAGAGGHGVTLSASPGAVFTFDSLEVTTTGGTALRADNAGLVDVNSTATTLAATNGPALEIVDTMGQTSGAPGWTFTSLSSTASPTTGVLLDGLTEDLLVSTGTTVLSPGTTGIAVQDSGGRSIDLGPTSVVDTNIGSGATADGIDLTTNNAGATFTFDSLVVATDGGFGLKADNSGTVNVGGGGNAIDATGGAALDSNQTLLNAGFASLTSTGSAGQGVRVENGGASALTVTGTTLVGSAGDAVRLNANTGATFSFGKLDLTTTAGTGLLAHSTGTVNVSDSTSTITAVGGPAVDVNPTALGVSLGTLSSTNSPTHGVSLDGASGSFSVTGTTTVTNATGNGVRIVSSSATVAFDDVTVNTRHDTGIQVNGATGTSVTFGDVVVPNPNNAGGYGIRVESSSAPVTVASATITDPTITVAEVDSNGDFVPENDGDGDAIFLKSNTAKLTLNGGTLSNAGADGIDIRSSPAPDIADLLIENPGRDTGVNFGHGIQAIDLTGTGTVLRSTIRGFTQSGTDGLRAINTNTNLTSLTLDAVSVTNSCAASLPPSCGNDGVFLSSRGTSNLTLVVTDSNTGDAVPSRFAGLFGHAVQVNAADTTGSNGTSSVTIENSLIENAKPGAGAAGGLNGIFLNTQFGATMSFTIQDNQIHDVARGNANGGIIQLNVQGGSSGIRTLTGTVSGNVIENSTGRRGVAVDVDTASGATGSTVVDVVVEDNDFNSFADREAFTGIFTDQGSVSHDVDLTFRNNRIGTCTNTVDSCTAGNVGGTRRAVLFQVLDSTTKTIDVLFEDNTIQTNSSVDAVGVQVLDASNTFNMTVLDNAITHNGSGLDALDVTLFDPGSIVCVDLNSANVGGDRNTFGKRYNLIHLDGTYRVEGLSGSQTAAAVLTFFNARNDGTAGAASTTGSFTGVASCPTP